MLQPGAKTDLILRFSTVAGELGAADAERDVRGFAVKFYTPEGNDGAVGFLRKALQLEPAGDDRIKGTSATDEIQESNALPA